MSRYILLVDDCEDAVPALQIALESFFACEVRHSTNAARSIATLEAGDVPLAVITDLNMPGTDGFALIRGIRASHLGIRLPIVVISADTHPATPTRVLALGADAFFAKPYSPAAICNSLERIFHAQTQLDPADARAVSPAGPDFSGPRNDEGPRTAGPARTTEP